MSSGPCIRHIICNAVIQGENMTSKKLRGLHPEYTGGQIRGALRWLVAEGRIKKSNYTVKDGTGPPFNIYIALDSRDYQTKITESLDQDRNIFLINKKAEKINLLKTFLPKVFDTQYDLLVSLIKDLQV